MTGLGIDDHELGEANLGPCCICGRSDGVICIVMLPQRGPVAGEGWGCITCGLPSNGAVAVLCEPCVAAWQAHDVPLKFVCRGHATRGERIPIGELPPGTFDHLFEHE
jgi:hypothetical protein